MRSSLSVGHFLSLGLGLCLPLVAIACSGEKERPPPYQFTTSDDDGENGGTSSMGGSSPGSDCDPIPEVNEEGSCASATVNLLQKRPTLYFVVDTSGSMSEQVVEGSESKLTAAQSALRTVVEEVGHRINYGLAAFPGPAMTEEELHKSGLAYGCEPGEEVFEIQEGDERVCLNLPAKGPVYTAFSRQVSRLRAEGKTPLAPTLDAISPALLRREGHTTVILLTDGHPNCGTNAACGPELCPFTGYANECTTEFNCCSDELASDLVLNPSSYCIDGPNSVEQVERLHSAGIDTYVVGLLGEADFDDIMNDLARAGGQARGGDRAYYDVNSLEELTDVVRAIGVKVAQSCTIELDEQPPSANSLNVYFDGQVVPMDADNGWTRDQRLVTLHGAACTTLQSGSITEVKLISGCETIIR